MSFHCCGRKGCKIEWIVCHYPVAPGQSADWCYNFYLKTTENKSAHYAVGRTGIREIVPEGKCAYHCSVAGKTVYCGATNMNSIGIDLMDDKVCRKTTKVGDTDWFIPEETLDRAATLIAELMAKYDIDIDHVVRHYDVTHKMCPRPLVGDDINDYYGVSGNDRWAEFKEKVLEVKACY